MVTRWQYGTIYKHEGQWRAKFGEVNAQHADDAIEQVHALIPPDASQVHAYAEADISATRGVQR